MKNLIFFEKTLLVFMFFLSTPDGVIAFLSGQSAVWQFTTAFYAALLLLDLE